MFKPIVAACTLAALSASASAAVLTFDHGGNATPVLCSNNADGSGPLVGCTNGGFFSQSYGDQAGVLDVRYGTPRLPAEQTLRWWNSAYNDLFGVVWAAGGDANSLARIDLVPLDGSGVWLHGFDLGAYANTSRQTTVEVRDLLTDELLWAFSGLVGQLPQNEATSFSPGVYAANGLRLEWRDSAFNVGIDNLDFSLEGASVGLVPEPAAAFWWVAAAAWAVSRRRRAG